MLARTNSPFRKKHISILEILSLAGVPFPRAVLNALEQLKQKHDEPPDGGE